MRMFRLLYKALRSHVVCDRCSRLNKKLTYYKDKNAKLEVELQKCKELITLADRQSE